MLQGAKIPQVSEDFFFGQFPCLKKGFRTEKKIDNLADWHQTAEAVGHTVPVVRNAWHTCRLSLWCVIQLFLFCGWKQHCTTHMQIVFVLCDSTVPVVRVKAALHDTLAVILLDVWRLYPQWPWQSTDHCSCSRIDPCHWGFRAVKYTNTSASHNITNHFSQSQHHQSQHHQTLQPVTTPPNISDSHNITGHNTTTHVSQSQHHQTLQPVTTPPNTSNSHNITSHNITSHFSQSQHHQTLRTSPNTSASHNITDIPHTQNKQ